MRRGGGDTAAEYVQYLYAAGNRVTIYALGGTTPNFLRTLGIAFNNDGPLFDDAGATNVPGLYLLGDLVVGKKGGSIITAFNYAVRAMKHICVNELTCK